jgi:hypothetical protein
LQYDAEIIEIQGDVLVNEGEKYVPASEGMQVRNGTRVMVMKDSHAKVKYHSCILDVESFQIHDVDDRKCAAIIVERTAYGAAESVALQNPGVVADLVAVVILLLNDDDDEVRSVSP